MKASPCDTQQENIEVNIFNQARRESHPMTIQSLMNPLQSARKEKPQGLRNSYGTLDRSLSDRRADNNNQPGSFV